MKKTILLTGATDGIGMHAAARLAEAGHRLLLHGRNPQKLEAVAASLPSGTQTYVADLSDLSQVTLLVAAVRRDHERLDVLINNAGVYKTTATTTSGRDIRFEVNTLAPWILTQGLLPRMGPTGRVVNLSSAAQSPVDLDALAGRKRLGVMAAYSQSKLAITAFTRVLAEEHPDGPLFVSVNPGSLLATKMVREGFGVAGKDVGIGADIVARAALDPDFEGRSGAYFDNDAGRFDDPHPAVLGPHAHEVTRAVRELTDGLV